MPNPNNITARQAAVLRAAAEALDGKKLGSHYFTDCEGNPIYPVHDHDRPDPNYPNIIPAAVDSADAICIIGAIAAGAVAVNDWNAAFAKQSMSSLRPAVADTLEALAPEMLLPEAGNADVAILGITTISDELLETRPQSVAKARAQRLLLHAAQYLASSRQ